MNEIGENFKSARIDANVSLEEASAYTEIPLQYLEKIEAGNIGAFKDIFKLKEYLGDYAKYLGQDVSEVIDKFNEYMFEYTSKIPISEIEKAIEDTEDKTQLNPVVSPYLKPSIPARKNHKTIIISIIVIVVLIALALIFAIGVIS